MRRGSRLDWRRFAWRQRWWLALLVGALVFAVVRAPWWYVRHVTPDHDLGATIALRSIAYGNTFREVERARGEVDRGLDERARLRLRRFLDTHRHAQPGQLHTHAVTDAQELLADIHLKQGRSRRALRQLVEARERTPLNWWLWYREGLIRRGRGDLAGAAEALREAFKQTLTHAAVARDLIEVLAQQGRHEQVLWVADHFDRARRRCAPFVQAKAGPARPGLQRRILDWSGIALEHGDYGGVLEITGLARGRERTFDLPAALFADVGDEGDGVYLQLRFQNVFDGLAIDSIAAVREDGTGERIDLDPAQMDWLHRPHSGGDCYVQVHLPLPRRGLAAVRVVYTCAQQVLSEAARALIAHARRNVDARKRP